MSLCLSLFDLKLTLVHRLCLFCRCFVSPNALWGEIWKGKEQNMEIAARFKSNSKALKQSLLSACSVWILSRARGDKADFIAWKGFTPAHPQSVWTFTGVAKQEGKSQQLFEDYPWNYFRKKNHLETDLLQVQHVLMCFTALQEEAECFNWWVFPRRAEDCWLLMCPGTDWHHGHSYGCPLKAVTPGDHALICLCPLTIALACHNYLCQ